MEHGSEDITDVVWIGLAWLLCWLEYPANGKDGAAFVPGQDWLQQRFSSIPIKEHDYPCAIPLKMFFSLRVRKRY
jgi:hypothetical protein